MKEEAVCAVAQQGALNGRRRCHYKCGATAPSVISRAASNRERKSAKEKMPKRIE